MSKRVIAIQLLLIALLLVGVCIPLGMDAAEHDRDLLTARAAAAADAYASEVKWRRLSTGRVKLPSEEDDDMALYSPDGVLTSSSGRPIPLTAAQLHSACTARVVLSPSATDGGRVVVLTPVTSDKGLLAVLVLARSDHATQVAIRNRWIRLFGGAGLASLVALALSVLLAQWVSRPLRRLERAAATLGDGELSARARAVGGPGEVRQLAASFDAMADRIEELVGGERAFLADVSHQIRTPLTAMRLRLELLTEDLLDNPVAAMEVGGTLTEVHRLSRMVDGLLAMARAHARDTARLPVAVDEVVAQRAVTWWPVAQAAGVELWTDVRDTTGALLTPGHLEQVLDNLLANALEASPPGGRVVVATAPAPALAGDVPMLRLTVTDDGPGMPAAARARAFERFRSETAKSRPVRADRRGNGLGLAVVHALVTADGGQVRLAEAASGGLLVVLDLPAAHTVAAVAAEAAPAPGADRGERHARASATG
ncbi:sensor histidine kinase [Pseudofrankia inefficax]|uniref:histidine kinase n=1 Tax=Pseudofrankia inefficax (strain DSM 45817 / CECT 9037 / DDB 130130 / EuI1c) TaxID=298654 RepID=E3J336_PSEI1|nr:HAMP domain-containing sensor histidine kinase [Pseudofrankia inefficax]ADP82986.1 integral membrane sensor signal transduction histidine kinase [Pseudofrankia inefficax]